MNKPKTLRISEIFFSLQGESSRIGLPTVFVRLTGCPLRCGYCDSQRAYTGGKSMSLDAILTEVAQYQPHYICVASRSRRRRSTNCCARCATPAIRSA